jgi:hypothetical protein
VFAVNNECPLCEAVAQRIDLPAEDVQHFKNCPNCKEYKISNAFIARIRTWRTGASDPHLNEELLKKLSIAARRAIERGEEPVSFTEENAGGVANWTY